MQPCQRCGGPVSTKRSTYCPECRKIRAKEAARRHYERNKSEIKRKATERNRQVPIETRRMYNLRYRPRKLAALYGVSVEEMAEWLAIDRCAICSAPSSERRLVIDHCHVSGKIRGRLCDRCNRCLGLLGDDSKVLRSAISYLEERND